jgi:hypothetical protein
VRELHAVADADAFERHERQHVAGAQPRVLARVRAQVDQLGRARHGAHRGLDHVLGRGHEGDDRAVVVRVHVRPEHERALDRLDGSDEPPDRLHVTALAEVRHTLDDAFHLRRPVLTVEVL